MLSSFSLTTLRSLRLFGHGPPPLPEFPSPKHRFKSEADPLDSIRYPEIESADRTASVPFIDDDTNYVPVGIRTNENGELVTPSENPHIPVNIDDLPQSDTQTRRSRQFWSLLLIGAGIGGSYLWCQYPWSIVHTERGITIFSSLRQVDPVKKIIVLENAAESGNKAAAEELELMYLLGDEVDSNMRLAQYYRSKSA